jgi:hypothetical protein
VLRLAAEAWVSRVRVSLGSWLSKRNGKMGILMGCDWNLVGFMMVHMLIWNFIVVNGDLPNKRGDMNWI